MLNLAIDQLDRVVTKHLVRFVSKSSTPEEVQSQISSVATPVALISEITTALITLRKELYGE